MSEMKVDRHVAAWGLLCAASGFLEDVIEADSWWFLLDACCCLIWLFFARLVDKHGAE